VTDDSLSQERLTEHLALVRPLQALLDDEPLAADGGTAHHPTLMVEVGKDDDEAAVLRTKHVLDGDLHVVEGNVGSPSDGRVGGLDGGCLDAFSAGDEEHSETAFGLATDGEVVGESSVGDPLLGAVDDEVFAVFGLDCGGPEMRTQC
jgi:hypothetical protein